ncbi:hypothetical protein [Bacillus phage BC-T25]|nr:hypothetical protein [Bacillus phage BC-T25]
MKYTDKDKNMVREIKIAITGELRSGKTTLQKYAEKNYGGFVPFAFADDLKEMFHAEFPHIPKNPKPRKGYQLYGQLMRFIFGEDYWINKCFHKIERVRRAAENYNILGDQVEFMPMITDARQPNEFERCYKEGYTLIRVEASAELRIERAKAEGDKFSLEDLQHESEKYVAEAPVHFVLYNNGSLETLYAQFDEVMTYLKGEQLNG